MPELRAQAAALRARLDELTRLRESILAERTTLAQAKASLERDRANLQALLTRKLARQQTLTAAAESEKARGERLAREATDLNDLIGRLETEAAARLPESRPENRPQTRPENEADRTAPPLAPSEADIEPPASSGGENPASAGPAAQPNTQTAMLSPPEREPGVPSSRLFSQAKGLVRLPAAGVIVRGFGEPNGLGGKTQGLTIGTRPGAQVIAPFDGKIVFAGTFRRYGQLLIISVGEGYHVLLAGMTRINGLAGQNILAGEPVGIMGSTSDEDSLVGENGSAGRSGMAGHKVSSGQRPALYIEFRKDGDPIDPRPWLMMSDKKARG
ncbi:MAG TPA: peptidoglycan DD-metalloendopeptidase family protein [Parvibaculum sp.]